MINVIDLVKHLFVSTIAVLSILNPFVVKPTPTPVPISIEAPTVTPSPTPTIPTQTTKTYVVPLPTTDPDPIVSCNISANCGGGTTPLRQSECANSTCCGFSGGKWIFYKDKNQCTKDQNAGYKQTTGNYTPPTANVYTPPSYPPCIVYYPGLGYSQTYSYISPEICKTWQDTASSGSTNTSQSTSQPTPTLYIAPTQPAQKSTEEILRCKSEVRAKYEDLIRGCYIKYQDSAANACARGYQGLSGTESLACEK